MKKLLFTGIVFVLALSLSAGAVFAGENGPKPNLLVSKIVELVENGLNSTVSSMNNITNIGEVMVNVTMVTDTLYYQTGGDWEILADPQVDDNDGNGYEIAVGETLELYNLFEFEFPVEARALKNVVEVEIDGRDKVFQAVWTMEFETEEPETEGEPVEGTVPAVKTQWQSGKSHVWHFRGADGTSGRLNCQIKGDHLTGVFNGKGLEAGGEYNLYLGEDYLGSGMANKAGKVHIKANGDLITADPTVDNISLIEFE